MPLIQTTGGNTQVSGYQRAVLTVGKQANYQRYAYIKFQDVAINGLSSFRSFTTFFSSEANVREKVDGINSHMTPGMVVTALSVATIVNVPAGTRVLVRGK